MSTKFVAAYARYSTNNQTENSIAYQMSRVEEYCAANNFVITRRYKDEAKSGTNINRRNFLDLLAAARNHEFDAVVIYDISRGSRDVGDWFAFRKEMMQLGVEVISVQDHLGNLLDPNDFLVELLGVGIGQHQVLQTRQKSIDGTISAAKEGLFLGGVAPYGYRIEDQKYYIVPSEAEIVKKIFAMYADGYSYGDILSALGHPIGRKGRPMGKNSLYAILKNDRYTGVYTWNRRQVKIMGKWAGGKENKNMVKIEGAIPQIIDKETWERVQSRLKENVHKGRQDKRKYLLTGLIHCDTCGATYCGRTSVNQRGYQNPYYVCGNKTRTRSCDSKNIKCEEIDTFVKEVVKSYLRSIDLHTVAVKLADQINSTCIDTSAEQTELIEVCAKIKRGTNAILDGMAYPELMEEIKELRARKAILEDKLSHVENRTVSAYALEEHLAYLIENLDENIEKVVRTFVIKINAHHDGSYTVVLGVAHTTSSGREI